MSWTPPPLPLMRRESIIAYWRAILAIPSTEPSAEVLRGMARQRLVELHARSRREAQHRASWH